MQPHAAVRFRLRWTDCDPAGIAYYPRFFEMMEAASQALAHEAGISREDMLAPSLLGLTSVESGASFLSPAEFEDELEVRTSVTRLGRSSLGLRHEIWRVAPGAPKLLVQAQETRVHVQRDADRRLQPRPLTESMRAVLERYLVAEEPATHG